MKKKNTTGRKRISDKMVGVICYVRESVIAKYKGIDKKKTAIENARILGAQMLVENAALEGRGHISP